MKLLFFIFLVLLVFLTACSAQPAVTSLAETLPASPPTETPFPIPSPTVNTQVSEQTQPSRSEQLQSTTWQWISFTSPVEQFDIETPENYLLTFNDDGSLNIKADCNNASGNYTIDGSSLSIEVGPMTRAACPPGSLSDTFVSNLGFSAIYFFQNGNLFIDMIADGGTLEFAPADVPVDVVGSLMGTAWQWSAFTNPVEQFPVEDPQNYLLAFNDDSTLNIKADCNNASGSYTIDGSSLNIEIGPMTLAACPPGSLSDQFIKYLGFSAIYFFKDGNLFIDMMADGGTMEFTPSSAEVLIDEAAPAETSPSGDQASLYQSLGNLAYSGILPDRSIKLKDGYANYEDGSSQLPYVELAGNMIPGGDLNGDGSLDAVAVLVDNTTGTGNFVYFVPVLNVLSEPVPLQAFLVGDRIPVKSLAIEGGQVTAELIMPGPGDPSCCPTQNVRKVYEYENDQLVERSSQELGKVNLADLDGTHWSLVDLNHDQEPLLPETEITLGFDDGQISGFAGCNDYSSPVTGDTELPQTFVVGPVAATKKICLDPVSNQESNYLARLENVLSWHYAFGYLSLVYRLGESEFGELLFAPQVQ